MGDERGLDLAKLDAEAADLDLEVGATHVVEVAVGPPAREVPAPVETRAGRVRERIGHEPLGPWPPGGRDNRALARLRPRKKLADDSGRHGLEPAVEEVEAPFGGSAESRSGSRRAPSRSASEIGR